MGKEDKSSKLERIARKAITISGAVILIGSANMLYNTTNIIKGENQKIMNKSLSNMEKTNYYLAIPAFITSFISATYLSTKNNKKILNYQI
ncbi:MAG: hypothetical protein PHH54_05080 [Candidatus Nanoarchaeia archaeon]|nr:hypothetical protein [Candidatus Nanoarchaeia archaeon]MDD5741332.1 hypothetical protein [Candidatus Nanoarchaeia archaeon]